MHNVIVVRSKRTSALYIKGVLVYSTPSPITDMPMWTLSYFISEMGHVTFKYVEVHEPYENNWPVFLRDLIFPTKI